MSEKYKFLNPEGMYFTTSTILNWIDLFTRKDYAEIVLDSLRHCEKRKGLVIHAWCLMHSHLHMIAGTKGKFDLHEIFRDFKKFTATEIIKCMNEINESRREWMLKLFSEEQRLTRITHYKVWQDGNNPVEAGIVWVAEDYCYSSATDYAGEKGYLDVEIIE